MCQALLELMKPEFDEAVNKAVNETINQAVNQAVSDNTLETKYEGVESIISHLGLSLTEACEILKIAVEDYLKVKEKRMASM